MDMRYIMKFGGTSVKNGGYARIADIISQYKKHEVVAVVSAIKGVTDKLIEITKVAEKGNKRAIDEFMMEIRELHREEARRSMGKIP